MHKPVKSLLSLAVLGAVIAIGIQIGNLFLNQHPSPQYNYSKTSSPSPINSSSSVSYSRLSTLLAAGKWKEADEETASLMLKVAGREKEGYFDDDSLRNFPKDDLRAIDRLWLKYSNGKFGFSVQKQIWLDLGGKLDGRWGKFDYDTYVKLADAVGWRRRGEWLSYNELTFNTNAPAGEFPQFPRGRWAGGGGGGVMGGELGILYSSL